MDQNDKPAAETEETARAALLQASADAARGVSFILRCSPTDPAALMAAANLLKWGSDAFEAAIRSRERAS